MVDWKDYFQIYSKLHLKDIGLYHISMSIVNYGIKILFRELYETWTLYKIINFW